MPPKKQSDDRMIVRLGHFVYVSVTPFSRLWDVAPCSFGLTSSRPSHYLHIHTHTLHFTSSTSAQQQPATASPSYESLPFSAEDSESSLSCLTSILPCCRLQDGISLMALRGNGDKCTWLPVLQERGPQFPQPKPSLPCPGSCSQSHIM